MVMGMSVVVTTKTLRNVTWVDDGQAVGYPRLQYLLTTLWTRYNYNGRAKLTIADLT